MSLVSSYSSLGRAATMSVGRLAVSSRKPAAATVTSTVARRFLSSTPHRGGGFFQRIGVFFTGAGIGCGIGYFYLAKEISGSTVALERAIEKSHKDLSDRVAKLERR